jgi:hypothetical protein
MADDPNNTKAAFDKNWASATEVGEYATQSNEGAWVLAPTIIREAILGGCPALLELDHGGQKNYAVPPDPTSNPTSNFWFPPDRLRWVSALNPSMRREDFFDRPWPWELRAYLSPSESWEIRDIEGRPIAQEPVKSTLRVFLHRAEAVQWGLLPSPPRVEPAEQPKKRRDARSKKRRGTRGPAPKKTDLVASRIRNDIRAKHFTMLGWRSTRAGRALQEGRLFEGSRRVPQKHLTKRYDCSSSTLLDALNIVWSEFRRNSERKTPSNSE